MRCALLGVLCAACCVASGAPGDGGRVNIPASQDIVSLLPLPKLDIAQVFEAADANHDERVTFQEAHSYNFLVSQDQFDSYDTNLDGYIDRAEAGLPPADVTISQIFESADTNNDNTLTFAEAYAFNNQITQEQFNAWDANHDGVVDRAEAGLPPVDPSGCQGCSSSKSLPAYGDLFAMVLSLFGLAVMAKVGRQ